MEKPDKKINFESVVASAGKVAKDLLDNTIQAVEMNVAWGI